MKAVVGERLHAPDRDRVARDLHVLADDDVGVREVGHELDVVGSHVRGEEVRQLAVDVELQAIEVARAVEEDAEILEPGGRHVAAHVENREQVAVAENPLRAPRRARIDDHVILVADLDLFLGRTLDHAERAVNPPIVSA